MMRFASLVGALLFLTPLIVPAATPWSSLDEAVAIQGYDTVAYFTKGEAQRGSSKFLHDWSGMTWFFATAEHRDMFAAAPEKFAPQFGGFCTLSVATGKNARGGGEAWTVHNGKLYLNYDLNVRKDFVKKINVNIKRAEDKWPL